MATIILLVLAVSLDAFSFGLAQGFNKNKISFFYAFCMSALSTVLFAVPLYLSSYIYKYLKSSICYLINGIILLLLGLFYLKNAVFKKKNEKTDNIALNFKNCMVSVFPISLDAIFTAFLSGYELNYVVFGIVFYFIVTLLFIYVPNKIVLKLSKKFKFNADWLSGIIFIILAILKFLEM